MQHPPYLMRPLLAGAVLLSLLLVGCDRNNAATTVGEQIDRAGTAISEATKDAGTAIGDASRAAVATASDTAITARIKAGLAADFGLAAATISVETTAGRAVLQGTVANDAARDRAAALAAGVEGVTAVDNQLVVGS